MDFVDWISHDPGFGKIRILAGDRGIKLSIFENFKAV